MGSRWEEVGRIAAVFGLIVLTVVIIWIDVATSFWQEVVVLSGFAGALLSFLFTILVLNRIISKRTAHRWAPMIHLALNEFLHSFADEEHSAVSRGMIVPRYLPQVRAAEALDPESGAGRDAHARTVAREHETLRARVVQERSRLAASLSSWAEILTSSGANDSILLGVADLAVHLDRVRDTSLEAERRPATSLNEQLEHEITRCNTLLDSLIAEISAQIRISAHTHQEQSIRARRI